MEPKIGPALKVIRERSGLTQRQLAAKLGCSHSHVVKIETGAERIDLGEFCLWCDVLEIPSIETFREVYEACVKDDVP